MVEIAAEPLGPFISAPSNLAILEVMRPPFV